MIKDWIFITVHFICNGAMTELVQKEIKFNC